MTIKDYKELFESKLPPKEDVILRNKKISSIYARLYLDHTDLFKWAGMAAFASNHIGIGLLPYHIEGFDLLDLSTSCRKRGLVNDFNLLRHINNAIFEDIAWTHQAYLDGGIPLLEKIFSGDGHYASMLEAWKALDLAKANIDNKEERNKNIWLANTMLLRHEQEFVVQPMFDRFGAVFKKVITLCASLDFDPNHFKTSFKYHSSFLWYIFSKRFGLLKESNCMPDLTQFNQRWTWLESKVVENWKKSEQYNVDLKKQVEMIL